MTEREHERFQDEINAIAERMAAKRGELGTFSLSYGTLDDLANFCKENF